MTAYRRGADFERRVKSRLEELGWTVFRTAGSHSPADLIAFWTRRPHEGWATPPRLYQCKSGVTTMPKKAKKLFYEFATSLGAEPWLAERGMKFTKLEEHLEPDSSSTDTETDRSLGAEERS